VILVTGLRLFQRRPRAPPRPSNRTPSYTAHQQSYIDFHACICFFSFLRNTPRRALCLSFAAVSIPRYCVCFRCFPGLKCPPASTADGGQPALWTTQDTEWRRGGQRNTLFPSQLTTDAGDERRTCVQTVVIRSRPSSGLGQAYCAGQIGTALGAPTTSPTPKYHSTVYTVFHLLPHPPSAPSSLCLWLAPRSRPPRAPLAAVRYSTGMILIQPERSYDRII
jgi:hypothetical protein